ncbi:MAG: NAD(P)-dependent alcohol dehydrogenase [SAR202 cluster bacterium]|nr:NAD(P)-dependent alcohol dehydrogenase [SAR202 cluster bacterium]
MKAVVQLRYGRPDDVLEVQDMLVPSIKGDEVLVRVHAASVHADVWHVVRGQPYILRLMGAGFLRPRNRIPGTDVAGRVEAVGPGVTRFRLGDEVFGETRRGNQWTNAGAFAEYVAVAQDSLALKPSTITFEQAAAVPTSGLIALSGLRYQANVQAGQRVLINGAGGGVGVFAVQLARACGAQVTAVDAAAKLDMLRSIGADSVIDYATEDFTRRGERYHLILDIPGNRTIAEYRRALTPDGTYVLIGHDRYDASQRRWFGSVPRFLTLAVMSPFVSHLKLSFATPSIKESIAALSDLIEAGKITPVVDRTFSLSEVREAIRYLEQGSVKGKIVLTV